MPLAIPKKRKMGDQGSTQIGEVPTMAYSDKVQGIKRGNTIDRRFLLSRYRITDGALRVGGIGSVGMRCLIALLEGQGDDDAIILQLKEARASALEPFLPPHPYTTQAGRVV
jgi:uncharacterized protein (DUF2252 family)